MGAKVMGLGLMKKGQEGSIFCTPAIELLSTVVWLSAASPAQKPGFF